MFFLAYSVADHTVKWQEEDKNSVCAPLIVMSLPCLPRVIVL